MTLLDPAAVDFVRDQWGRPLIVPPDGGKPVAYVRSSSAAKTVEDTYNLELWARRNVAFGMAHDPSLVARMLALPGSPTTWNDEQRREVTKVHEAAATVALAHKGADIGSAVHTMTQRVDLGEQFDAGIYTPDINAYVAALIDAGYSTRPEWVECRLVCDELKMAGTADRLITTADGRYLVADLKTGQSAEYGGLGWSAQLAAYSHGLLYDVELGKRLETPPLDRTVGVIIHLPAGQGRCTLYEVDLVAGFRAAQLANEIRAVRAASKRWIKPITTITAEAPPEPLETPANVLRLTGLVGRRERLRARYEQLHPAQAQAFRELMIDPSDLEAIEAALDELTEPQLVPADRLRSDEIAEISARLLGLSSRDHTLIGEIVAAAAVGPRRISYRYEPHVRNLHVSRALVGMCEYGWDEHLFRELIACAVDDGLAELATTSVADWLAEMSTGEAAALDGLVAALGD